jgi:hypothetical protein
MSIYQPVPALLPAVGPMTSIQWSGSGGAGDRLVS